MNDNIIGDKEFDSDHKDRKKRSKSADTQKERERLSRKAKENKNYKETKTYKKVPTANKKITAPEDTFTGTVDVSARSTKTVRTPPRSTLQEPYLTVQQYLAQASSESTATTSGKQSSYLPPNNSTPFAKQSDLVEKEAEYLDLSEIANSSTSPKITVIENASPQGENQNVNFEITDDESALESSDDALDKTIDTDLLSSDIPKRPETPLSPPLQAENVSQLKSQFKLGEFDQNFHEHVSIKRENLELVDLEEKLPSPIAVNVDKTVMPLGVQVDQLLPITPTNNQVPQIPQLRVQLPIMADMWLKMAKQVPEICASDSSDQLFEKIDKLRSLGRLVPDSDWELFSKQILIKFDSEIRRKITDGPEFKNGDELCDFLQEKLVAKGSYAKNIRELDNMKRRRGETLADFGKRILKLKDLCDRQYLYRHRGTESNAGSEDTEMKALETFMRYARQNLPLLLAIGNPKNIREAVDATEKFEPEIEVAPLDEDPLKSSVPQASHYRAPLGTCQKCANRGHEALYCPVTPCLYCKSSMHKSAECPSVGPETKINIICKECRAPGHTIDMCSKRLDNEMFCQICQAANAHSAQSCDVAVQLSITAAKKIVQADQLADNLGTLSLNAVGPTFNPTARDRPNNNTCQLCGDQGHPWANCPMFTKNFLSWDDVERMGGPRRNQNFRGNQSFRGNQNFRGYLQRGQNYNRGTNRPNFQPHYNQAPQNGYQRNFDNRNFYRGGKGHYNGNGFRGRGNFQGYQSQQNYQNYGNRNFDNRQRYYQNQGHNPNNPFLDPRTMGQQGPQGAIAWPQAPQQAVPQNRNGGNFSPQVQPAVTYPPSEYDGPTGTKN